MEDPWGHWPEWHDAAKVLVVLIVIPVVVSDLSALGYLVQLEFVAPPVVLIAAWGIRKLPPAWWVSRYGKWLFWTPAAIAAVAVALRLGTDAIVLTAAAVVLGAGAIVQAAYPKAAAELLSQAALACGGVAFLGDGAIVATHRHVLIGVELAALGVAFIGTALASLSDWRASIGAVAVCGLGMEFAALGTALLAERHALIYLPLLGISLAIVVDGMTLAIDSQSLNYTAVILSGLAVIGVGAALLADRQPLTGGAVVLLGVAVIGTASALAGQHRLGYTAVTASGVAAIVTGIAWHAEHQVLLVTMVIAGGVATSWFGSMEIRGIRRIAGSIVKGPSA
jgi:hypothetical protein